MRALDIPTEVEWTYIMRAWHKAMHTCVEQHILHSIVGEYERLKVSMVNVVRSLQVS